MITVADFTGLVVRGMLPGRGRDVLQLGCLYRAIAQTAVSYQALGKTVKRAADS